MIQSFASMAFYKSLFAKRQRQEAREQVMSLYSDAFKRLAVCINPAICIECGANEADFSCWAATHLRNCRVLAYEASPYVYDYYNKRKNFADFSVEYINKAISAKSGEVSFFIEKDKNSGTVDPQAGISSLLRQNGRFFPDFQEHECRVLATTIDDILFDAKPTPSCCLWCDVEGATQELLAGAARSFQNNRIALVNIEVESIERWKNQMLHEDVIKFFSAHNMFFLLCDNYSPAQYNITFIHRSRLSPETLLIAADYAGRVSCIAEDNEIPCILTQLRNAIYLNLAKRGIHDIFFYPSQDAPLHLQLFQIVPSGAPTGFHYEMYTDDYNIINICFHVECEEASIKNRCMDSLKVDLNTLSAAFASIFPYLHHAPVVTRLGLEFPVPLSLALTELYSDILQWLMDETMKYIKPYMCQA